MYPANPDRYGYHEDSGCGLDGCKYVPRPGPVQEGGDEKSPLVGEMFRAFYEGDTEKPV